MKVGLSLICFFFLTLQDGEAEKNTEGKEGGNITFGCLFVLPGTTKYFCKEKCEGENILIETTNDRDQRGRYSIMYEKKGITSYDVLHVSITELKLSDSGRYRCGLDIPSFRHDDFILNVTEASTTSEPKLTFTSTFPSSASVTTAAATSTQRLSSSSSSSSSSETIQHTTESTGPSAANQLLYVGLVLVILIILLAAALLIFCKRKSFGQQEGPPMKTPHLEFTIDNTVYEEIRELDKENKPPPGEISSVSSHVKSRKTNGPESNEVYSLASCPQDKKEEDKVEHSEVHFSNSATSSNSDPCGLVDNAIYGT